MSEQRSSARRRKRRTEEVEDRDEGRSIQVSVDWVDPWSDDVPALLEAGDVVGYQQISVGSNYTFVLVLQDQAGKNFLTVYKPRRGEVPLWDFPDGTLYKREVAAYVFARALGWRFIPPTILRDGPFGIGSVQLFVKPGGSTSLYDFHKECGRDLCQITLFDHMANNADRKPTHVLRSEDGRVWAIDHGLTFHEEWKLRTVIWEYVGEPIPAPFLDDVRALLDDTHRIADLRAEMTELISPGEFRALLIRAKRLARSGVFPALDPGYNVPRGFW
jgi:hypothetical protein